MNILARRFRNTGAGNAICITIYYRKKLENPLVMLHTEKTAENWLLPKLFVGSKFLDFTIICRYMLSAPSTNRIL